VTLLSISLPPKKFPLNEKEIDIVVNKKEIEILL
jgi:hypothetical protein